jgi:alpha-N-arabinofuranosidase
MKIPLVLALGWFSFAGYADNPSFTVEAGHAAGKVSPRLYGLMTEEINHSYDGGLYAELIQNRAFQDDASRPVHWSALNEGNSAATIALDPAEPLNDKLASSLRLVVTKADTENPAGVANDGYWGIPVRSKTTYHASLFAKGEPGFSGSVTVAIVSDDGKNVYATGEISGLAADWKKYEVILKTGRVTPTAKAHFAITLDHPGTIWLGFVSLFPPTWGDQPNGFRPDLMQMLADLHPKFLRCPGGNYLEGDTVGTRFEWKQTIGPIEQRPGHAGPWGYRSSDGLGLLEFLEWCEDMRAEPVLAVYAGYSLRGQHVNPGADLEPYVQDALEEIEYVTGDSNTVWGAHRAQDGHPAPFALHCVEIGNEDGFDKSGSYDARFAQFYDAIKSKYPQLKTISTIGDDQPEKSRVQSRKPDLMDGHYYRSADRFISMSPSYADAYDRSGPEVFVGEWAAYETSFPPWDKRSEKEPPTPDLKAAVGDAAFMAAMERNSDLIKMQCYAPLLVNVNPGGRQWRPNLIGYDAMAAYGSPSYYAIKMFSRNLGDEILATTPAETSVQGCATRDSVTGAIFVKLVNAATNSVSLNVAINGVTALASTATAITLAANTDESNSIAQPKEIVPVTKTIRGIKPRFTYALPANSIVVLKLNVR